jgi:hypothetical protein
MNVLQEYIIEPIIKNSASAKSIFLTAFLAQKTPEFESLVPDISEPLDIFLHVNREIRKQNRAKMAERGKDTSPQPLWEGHFLRQPKAATLAL